MGSEMCIRDRHAASGDSACTFSREPSTWRARDLDSYTHRMMVSVTICRAPSGSKGFARKGTRRFEVCSACATRQRALWSAVAVQLISARYKLRRQRSRSAHVCWTSQSCGSPGGRRPSPPPPPRWRRVARWRCTASPYVCIRVRVSLWVPASGMILLHGVRYAQTLRTAQSGRYASRFKK